MDDNARSHSSRARAAPRRASGRLAAVGVLASLAWPAAAIDCIYRGSDDTARVVRRSGEVLAPFPAAMSDRNCERLRVESGAVDVTWIGGNDGDTLMTRRVDRGSLVTAAQAADASAPGLLRSLMSQARVVLQGAERRVLGASRGDGDELLSALLPTGKIATPERDLLVQVAPGPDPLVQRFALSRQGKAVHVQTGPAQTLVLPAAALVEGSVVEWELVYDGRSVRGQFSVEPRSARQTLVDASQTRHSGVTAPMVKRMRVAADLLAQGYAWDARQVLEGALLE